MKPKLHFIMKKILVILALSLVALSAKAQVYVGGSLAFAGSGNAAAFSIAPEAGYCFDDSMAAGLSLGLGFGNGATTLSIDPYFRYFLPRWVPSASLATLTSTSRTRWPVMPALPPGASAYVPVFP